MNHVSIAGPFDDLLAQSEALFEETTQMAEEEARRQAEAAPETLTEEARRQAEELARQAGLLPAGYATWTPEQRAAALQQILQTAPQIDPRRAGTAPRFTLTLPGAPAKRPISPLVIGLGVAALAAGGYYFMRRRRR